MPVFRSRSKPVPVHFGRIRCEGLAPGSAEVESLLFIGAEAGEKIPGSGQKRTASATLHTTLLTKTHKKQCCGAETFFLGSGSRYFFSAPAPPIKPLLRSAPAPKNRFLYKYMTNLNFNKNVSINLDFVPKTEKTLEKKELLRLKKLL